MLLMLRPLVEGRLPGPTPIIEDAEEDAEALLAPPTKEKPLRPARPLLLPLLLLLAATGTAAAPPPPALLLLPPRPRLSNAATRLAGLDEAAAAGAGCLRAERGAVEDNGLTAADAAVVEVAPRLKEETGAAGDMPARPRPAIIPSIALLLLPLVDAGAAAGAGAGVVRAARPPSPPSPPIG